MTTNVLFLCDHSAGKSLLAATYFRAAAARAGLDVAIDIAGPDPDEQPMPNVVAALESQGHTVSWNPRRVTEEDLSNADEVVSIGCSLDDLPLDCRTSPIIEWDVPMLSQDFDGAVRSIFAAAESFAASFEQD